jgi:rfaE bifunctional protein nucleotidyltransferase chain/domain
MSRAGRPAGPLVVIGDSLLDVDISGAVTRTCPDAPAPVVDVQARTERPGGAALAARLAAEDTDDVVLVTALSDDEGADAIRRGLAGRVRVVTLGCDGSTPVKTRVRADEQTLLRLDTGRAGQVTSLPPELEQLLERAGAVLVSDYGCGVAQDERIRSRLEAVAARVPLVWDPHPRGGAPVPGTLVATPNEREVRAASGLATSGAGSGLDGLARDARRLVARWGVGAVAVTRGPAGALVSYGADVPFVVPARPAPGRPVDTCGAGDRFAAALTAAVLRGGVIREAVGIAVQTAADFVAAGAAAGLSAPGPAPDPTAGVDAMLQTVRAAGGTVVATGGCFDLLHVGHIETLEGARRLGDCLVVCLNSDASVRRLKGPGRPLVAQADRIRLLEALDCVDAVVVFDEDTPEQVLRRLRPQVWCKGGDYADGRLPEETVLEEWSGQAVVLPYVAGRSTTRLARAQEHLAPDLPREGAHRWTPTSEP